MLRLPDVVVDPFADLASSVSLEAHPYFQAAETARLLESVDVILVALVGVIEFVGKVGRLDPKRRSQPALIFHQYGASIERSVEPFVRINGDRVRELEAPVMPGHACDSN